MDNFLGERQLSFHDHHLCPQVSFCLLVCLSAFFCCSRRPCRIFFSTLGHPDTQDAESFVWRRWRSRILPTGIPKDPGEREGADQETSPERSRAANPKQSPIVYQDPYPNGGSRDIINGAYSSTPQR